MRILLFLICCFFALYSCNNNLTSIGQDLVDDDKGSIESIRFNIDETYTIKIDSFITSSAYASGSNAINQLIVGRYQDNFSGETTADAYFTIVPEASSIGRGYTLDSVTFNFAYGGQLWGDTVNQSLQTLELWQTSKLPMLNADDNNYLYNTYSIPVAGDAPLATARFFPRLDNLRKAYFLLPKEWGMDYFNKLMYGDTIFKSDWAFLHHFKGLVIKPSLENNCIFSIKAIKDSLYLRFHYHDATTSEKTLDFKLSNKEFQFNNFTNKPAPLFRTLVRQSDKVSFLDSDNRSLCQGLAGYLLRLDLPKPIGTPQYKTLIKAELELNPIYMYNDRIALPPSLYIYLSNEKNEIVQQLRTGEEPVVGRLVQDDLDPGKNKYIFNLTDYYQQLLVNPATPDKIEVLISVPSLGLSFNRVILDQIPILRLYYATYKN